MSNLLIGLIIFVTLYLFLVIGMLIRDHIKNKPFQPGYRFIYPIIFLAELIMYLG